ncbi:MAG: hypothetical protein IJ745_05460 [Bacteroidales bacterium]|nr:hypothetical protein [Bacteroidales bacterium]
MKLALCVGIVFNFQFPILNSASAQEDSTGRLTLVVENHHFFKDNEYGLKRMDGYTLPGFYFRPRIAWQVEKRVHLEVGAHWLNFWGAHAYPTMISYTSAHPTWSDTSARVHVQPWVQARVDFAPWIAVVIGNLDNRHGHGLPTPLYNRELSYAADPEAGVQMLVDCPWIDIDAWADWREFIFDRSKHQEQFYVGTATHLKLPLGKGWTLYSPLYLLAQHTGGEGLDTPVYLHTKNKVNFGFGAGVRYEEGDFGADLEVLGLRFKQQRDTSIHFSSGWAFSPTLRLRWRSIGFEANWWDGENFIPLMGCAHYSNKSLNDNNITFDRIQNLTLKLQYKWRGFHACSVMTEAEMIHYFPYTQYEVGMPPEERGHATMVATGIHVMLNPTITLKR